MTPDEFLPFLKTDDVIQARHPAVVAQAALLFGASPEQTARNCFEWVRDWIEHSIDAARPEMPCNAADVLAIGTSLCVGKSHLLVALLRANGIPSGLVYQRLRFHDEQSGFCTHGLVALWLDGHGWYRCDARGNRTGIDCQFTPGRENLAFPIVHEGERLWPEVWAAPWPELVTAMRAMREVGNYKQAPIDVEAPSEAVAIIF
jgi:transglutaminase-like putative cysteine protease